jgi:membrane protein
VLLAAGVAFFGMFAIFPALVAVISLYGLLADPSDVQSQVDSFAAALPASTQTFLQDQLDRIVSGSSAGLGFALLLSVAVALWSASSGVGHLLEAVNAAYGEAPESFVKARLRSLVLALGGVLVMVIVVGALTVLPGLVGQVSSALRTAAVWARWPLIAVVMIGVLAVVYRSGSNRDDPRWRWTSVGGFVATAAWLLSSGGLAIYASTVGSLDAAYGSFGGVLVVMLWLLLSALSILFGAYLNAELEHQTEKDTTTGPERPMGEREARMADAPSPSGSPTAGDLRAQRAESEPTPQR